MSNTALLTVDAFPRGPRPPDVEIVIPVYNEEHDLKASIHRLHGYLSEEFPSRGW